MREWTTQKPANNTMNTVIYMSKALLPTLNVHHIPACCWSCHCFCPFGSAGYIGLSQICSEIIGSDRALF